MSLGIQCLQAICAPIYSGNKIEKTLSPEQLIGILMDKNSKISSSSTTAAPMPEDKNGFPKDDYYHDYPRSKPCRQKVCDKLVAITIDSPKYKARVKIYYTFLGGKYASSATRIGIKQVIGDISVPIGFVVPYSHVSLKTMKVDKVKRRPFGVTRAPVKPAMELMLSRRLETILSKVKNKQ